MLLVGRAVAMVVPPTLVIQQQMQELMTAWGTKWLNLGDVDPEELAATLRRTKPSLLIASIERLQDKRVLDALLTVRLSYVAIDEAQVSSCPRQYKLSKFLIPGHRPTDRMDRVPSIPPRDLAAPDHRPQLSLPVVLRHLQRRDAGAPVQGLQRPQGGRGCALHVS